MDKRLCYIERVGDWMDVFQLYFTDNLVDQWGDDWNDTPAVSNAESPYEDETHHIESMFIKLDYSYNFIFGGESYSVELLNQRIACWFVIEKEKEKTLIQGGETMEEVVTSLAKIGIPCFIQYKGE